MERKIRRCCRISAGRPIHAASQPLVQSTPPRGAQPRVFHIVYPLPGDKEAALANGLFSTSRPAHAPIWCSPPEPILYYFGPNFEWSDDSKAVYQNLHAIGLDDHIVAIRAMAAKYPWMDTSRVGIYGYSADGFDVVRAMTDASRFLQGRADRCRRVEQPPRQGVT